MRLVVDVLAGVPGSGKSEWMLTEAAAAPAKYLFALPTINLIDEQADRFRLLSPHAHCASIHSQTKARGAVSRQIGELRDRFTTDEHVAAFITHEALMECDFSGFVGWNARVDEPPNAITCGEVTISQSLATFERHFELEPFDAGWSRLRPTGAKSSWKDVAGDTLWRRLTDFRKLAARPQGVLIQLSRWEDAAGAGALPWFSLWTPLDLRAFDNVIIAGSGFLTSTACKVMRSTYGKELEFKVKTVANDRTAQPQIRIMYFTRGHRGSTTFWETSEGRKCLVEIERWIGANVPDLGFWSGNEVVQKSMEHRLPGQMTTPKVAGLNRYRDQQSCAILYSSKPLPEDGTLKTIFELTDEDILGAREGEDIFQFVMRGALRNPAFGGVYDIYLYSVDQAERLGATLLENGFGDVELAPVMDVGVMDVSRPKCSRVGKPSQQQSEAMKLQRKAENARRNRELRARRKVALAAVADPA